MSLSIFLEAKRFRVQAQPRSPGQLKNKIIKQGETQEWQNGDRLSRRVHELASCQEY